MFRLVIIDPQRILFEGEVKSVFLPGDSGEFEILDFHKPIISLLKDGIIIIDKERVAVAIKSGVVKMYKNELVILVER